ncbi:MAG: spore coat polysaccharide biosynthesis protein SpsC [Parcubacteria group bacterium Athens0714_26]|nr:MAG: spore coat polysaccharide biosynthesis protein SpsC [Parcubacteria group bacterium Athens1014_26]TSD03035.1 MAG: spore coat polysaccharide biosynthesis protein SpsC [Parcubacteria group bacterium Athens0714_26]
MTILFGKPDIGNEEIEAVTKVLKSGWIGMGPKCIEFEKLFAEYVGSKYAVAVSSCTAALHLSLAALGIGPEDEVITTPFTFVATVNAIEHVGAKPVFVDIDLETLNMNPDLLEIAITSKTKAIIPVHFGGLPCFMNRILQIAKQHNLYVVEDAAHAIGAKIDGCMVGGIKDSIACFSFYPNKNITSIEGGMITTDSEDFKKKLEIMRLHGLDNEAWKRYCSGANFTLSRAVMPGFKYNMTDVQAAVGICQLKKLEKFLEIKEKYASIYDREFADLPCARQYRHKSTKINRHALHLYLLILNRSQLDANRNEIVTEIRERGIGATVHYEAVHLHPYFQERLGFSEGSFPITEYVAENILTLPLGSSMSQEEIEWVVKKVKEVVISHRV